MSNTRIPIFRNTETFKASDVPLLKDNIQKEMDAMAESALQRQEDIINTKLQNDKMRFESMAYESLQRDWQSNQGNPGELQRAFNSSKKDLMRAVPFALRPQAESWYTSNTQGYLAKASQNEIKILNDESKALALGNINQATLSINEKAANLFSENSELSLQSLESIGADLISIDGYMGVIGADGLPQFSEVDKLDTVLGIKDNVFTGGMKGHFDNLKTIDEKTEFFKKLSNKDVTINFKNISGEIEEINVVNQLDRGKFESIRNYMAQTIRSLLANSKKDEQVNHINNVLTGKTSADPASKIHIEAANVFYDEVLRPALQSKDFEERSQEMLEYVKNVEVFPDTMGREIKTLTNGGDDNGLLMAAKFVSKAKVAYPLAYASLNTKEMSVLMTLENDLSAGVEQKIALDNANGLLNPITADIFKARDQEFREFARTKKTNFKGNAVSIFKEGKFFSRAPKLDENTIIPDQLGRDYMQIQKALYINTRNEQTVKDVSAATIVNRYAVTEVMYPDNQKIVARDGIEGIYGDPRLDNQYIRRQAVDLAGIFIKENKLNLNPERVIILSDPLTRTQIENNISPSYSLMAPDEFGHYELLGQSINKSIRFIPDKNIEINRLLKKLQVETEENINLLEEQYEKINRVQEEQLNFETLARPELIYKGFE